MEDGECTFEPLDIIGKDDPITCALYAKQNNLLDEPGWKRFKRLATREVKFQRMINQARLYAVRRINRYKYGYKVPNTHEEAMQFDKENGNTLWADAEALEIEQLFEYSTFIDKGKGAPAPAGFKLIRCHMVYDVKHDGRHRARLVAGGHLTSIPLESIYSGVVTLRGLRLIVFLGELNGLPLILKKDVAPKNHAVWSGIRTTRTHNVRSELLNKTIHRPVLYCLQVPVIYLYIRMHTLLAYYFCILYAHTLSAYCICILFSHT